MSIKRLARISVITALYVALSLITFGFSSSSVQIRLSESLCLLPLLMPESCISLFLGCVISNLIAGCHLIDVFLGGLITLVSAVLTALTRIKKPFFKYFIGGLYPVLLNAFLLPLIFEYCYGLKYVYIYQALILLASQSISVYLLGVPITVATDKLIIKKIQ